MSITIKSEEERVTALIALYGAAIPLGMGYLEFRPGPLARIEAASYLAESNYFDYLMGRVMKVKIPKVGGSFDLSFYDRDNGTGTGEVALRSVGIT
jgi:hypothetical protein